LDAWDNLGFDLKGFQQNPQIIGPPGKPEGNAAHRVHNIVSHEIANGGLEELEVCSQGRDNGCVLFLFLMHHIYYSFINQNMHACCHNLH
jgi:hypothetical protein